MAEESGKQTHPGGHVLVLGATSEIGGEIAVDLCYQRHVVLAARRVDGLTQLEQRLKQAGASAVTIMHFDALDYASHRRIVQQARDIAGDIGYAIVCFGILGQQAQAETDEHHAVEIASVDYTAQVCALTVLADEMRKQSIHSTIVAFSSIAGWRARRANYVYGSTKAGLDAFCQGLADALHGSHVRLFIARPGFVIGRMTQGMKPAPLSVDAPQVAAAIHAELVRQNRSNKFRSTTLWIPTSLAALAAVMRIVPRAIWRKMPR